VLFNPSIRTVSNVLKIILVLIDGLLFILESDSKDLK
jgi:hypothetical protein